MSSADPSSTRLLSNNNNNTSPVPAEEARRSSGFEGATLLLQSASTTTGSGDAGGTKTPSFRRLLRSIFVHRQFSAPSHEEAYRQFYFANQKRTGVAFMLNTVIFQLILIIDMLCGRLRPDAADLPHFASSSSALSSNGSLGFLLLLATGLMLLINSGLFVLLVVVLFRHRAKDDASATRTRQLSHFILLASFVLACAQLCAFVVVHPAEKAGGGIAFHPVLVFVFLQLPFSQSTGALFGLTSSLLLAILSTWKAAWIPAVDSSQLSSTMTTTPLYDAYGEREFQADEFSFFDDDTSTVSGVGYDASPDHSTDRVLLRMVSVRVCLT